MGKKVIYKYAIPGASASFSFPSDAKVVHVGEQYSQVMLWIEHDPLSDTHMMRRNFRIVGTGHKEIEDTWLHIVTVQMKSGLVWHVYETDVVKEWSNGDAEMYVEQKTDAQKIDKAIKMLLDYMGIDGGHHKQYGIAEAIKILAGSQYAAVKQEWCDGEDGPATYEWDNGIPA